jgi:hypothetical protein
MGRSKDRGEIYHGKACQALGSYRQLDLGNLGNVCGIGLLLASSLHRIPCVSMIVYCTIWTGL